MLESYANIYSIIYCNVSELSYAMIVSAVYLGNTGFVLCVWTLIWSYLPCWVDPATTSIYFYKHRIILAREIFNVTSWANYNVFIKNNMWYILWIHHIFLMIRNGIRYLFLNIFQRKTSILISQLCSYVQVT